MATGGQPTLFNQTISRILDCWTALKIAVEHGFGGSNSKQKVQDLIDDIENTFKKNGRRIDPYDFAEYLEDKMDDEFNMELQDGSAQLIASHICQCFTLLGENRVGEVEEFLKKLPSTAQARIQCQGGDSSSDEGDDEEGMDSSSSQAQQRSAQATQPQATQEAASSHPEAANSANGTANNLPSTNGAGDAMDVDNEEDDGWTVVEKKGRRR